MSDSSCAPTRQGLPWTTLREEPFRIFFPLSVVASVVGVALWPLVYAGWLNFYPAEAHARIMIHGFVGGAALGFLGTAFPRMAEAPPLTWPEVLLLLLAFLGTVVSHAIGAIAAGDACFLFNWLFLCGVLGARFAFFRQSLPPPGFILVAMGIASAIAATTILCCGRLIVLSIAQRTLAQLLLYEAFITAPILGIGSILFPRFFAADETPPPRRRLTAAGASLIAGVLLATYIAQAYGLGTLAPVLRGTIITAFLILSLPLLWRGHATGMLSIIIRAALACLVGGILLSTAPGQTLQEQIALRHFLFIGGYGLLVLAIGSRVILGHSGNLHLVKSRAKTFKIVLGIVILGLLTRIVADYIPAIRVSHHIYAALSWILAVGLWSWAVLRYVRTPDPEDAEDRPC